MEDLKSVSDLRSAIMKLRKEVMPPVSKMKKADLKTTYEKMAGLKTPAPEVKAEKPKGRPEKGSEEAKARMAQIRAKRGEKKDEKK
jgi:hypothetical protein